jgi:hypothetical protein
MPDVEYEGWGSRLVKSLGGIVIGALLFLVSFPVLFWNEGRAVHRAQSLDEGAAACIAVNADKVDAANNGKLVYVSGEATTAETLTDPQFGVSAKALKLERTVEIYQWVERSESKKERKTGGGEVTTTYYYHDKKWVKEPVNSSSFRPDDGQYKGQELSNQGTKPFDDTTERAKVVKIGAFQLTAAQVDRIGHGTQLPVTSAMLAALPGDLKDKLKTTSDGALYQPFAADGDPSKPSIGDVRITFTELKPQPVSLIARQAGESFEPWASPSGSGTIDELRAGTLSKEAMFQKAQEENTVLTWVLRVVGCGLMALGIFLFFRPLKVLADVLPFLGDLMGAGIGLFAILVAVPLSLITIALGWVAYRPLVGIPLLLAGVGLLIGGVMLGRRRKAARLAAAQGSGK